MWELSIVPTTILQTFFEITIWNNYNFSKTRQGVIIMKVGEAVKVRTYGDKELIRYVIHIDKDIVVVCSPDEYKLAKSEGREPIGVGFRLKDVISELEGVQI